MIAAAAARLAVDLLSRTWRIDVGGAEHHRRVRDTGAPVVFAVWHGDLLAALCRHRGEGISLLVSGHRDGQYLAGAARRWGFRTIRGSSTRGSVAGLRGLIRALRSGHDVAVTPDGPRGPARVPKPGAVMAAQLSGAPIIPVGTAATPAWRSGSWDHFVLPRPRARVTIVYGPPLRVAPGEAGLAQGTAELGDALDQAGREARCRL